MSVEPSSDFWGYLIIGVLTFTLVAVIAAVFILKLFVFRPAEKRAKREADADGTYGPMERTELVSLIQKLDDNDANIVAREIAKQKFLEDFRQELTEPLTFIKKESSVLSQYLSDNSSAEAARGIHNAASKLEGLILDLYELYTLEVGKARLAQETVSVQHLIDEITNQFEVMSDGTANRLEFEVGHKVGSIITDHAKFNKLLMCMVESANSYTVNGNIRVEISFAEDGRLRLTVSDDGQLEKNRTDWSGLRLPLIKKLSEFLGGSFSIEERPGGGAISTAHISVRSL